MQDFIKPRLYLITPPVADGESFRAEARGGAGRGRRRLRAAALRAAGRGNAEKNRQERSRQLVQDHGAALLLLDDAQLAARAGADGVHVTGIGEKLDAALESLKPDRIVGVGGLADKDQAMSAGRTRYRLRHVRRSRSGRGER